MILDEFGFDRVERLESPQAASLLYKLINVRDERSTALETNVDFEKWGEYWATRRWRWRSWTGSWTGRPS